MALTDPLVALQSALLAHLEASVTLDGQTLRFQRGWPEQSTDLSLSSGPLVVTVTGEDTQTPTSPRPVGQTEEGETLYKVAELLVPLQLHLLAAYRVLCDDLVVQLAAALSNRLPSSPDLWLTSSDYYGRPLTFSRTRLRRNDEAQAAAVGSWEAIWSLTCRSDLVVPASHPALTTLTLRLNDERSGESEDSTPLS